MFTVKLKQSEACSVLLIVKSLVLAVVRHKAPCLICSLKLCVNVMFSLCFRGTQIRLQLNV